jgi:hypothetical protein
LYSWVNGTPGELRVLQVRNNSSEFWRYCLLAPVLLLKSLICSYPWAIACQPLIFFYLEAFRILSYHTLL